MAIKLQNLEPIEGLGTFWYFELERGRELQILPILKNTIREFNQNYSRFDENSLVSQLNKNKELEVDNEEFIELLRLGIIYYTKTNKIFNFLLEGQLTNLGYDKDYTFQEKNNQLKLPSPSLDLIIQNKTIFLKKGGVDFGGFGKGFLIDKISKILQSQFQLQNFIINAGGDIFCHTKEAQSFHLQHPTKKSQSIGQIEISNSAIASSSTFLRNWNTNKGKNKNHLINPFTQDSIEPSAVFVTSNTAVEADMWATTIAIANEKQIHEFQKKYPIEYLKITNKEVLRSNLFKKIE